MSRAELLAELARTRARLASLQASADAPDNATTPLNWPSIVSHLPDLLLVVDARGRVCYANRMLHRIEPAQLVGRPVVELVDPDSVNDLRQALAQVFQLGESLQIQIIFTDTEPGTVMNCQLLPIVTDHVVTQVLVDGRNMTPSLEIQRALRASEDKFRQLSEHLPGVVYLCRNDARYTMLYVNDFINELTGYDAQAFLDDKVCFAELFHPEDAKRIPSMVDNAVARREPFRLNYRIRHRTRGWRWVDEVGVGIFEDDQLTHLEGFISDVTESRQAHEKVVKMAHMMQSIQENMPVLVFRIDSQGVFQESKGAGLRRLGLVDNQAVGMNALQMYPESAEHLLAALDGQTRHFEATGETDGQPWWFDVHVFPDRLDDGGADGLAMDITDRKLSEQALREAHDKLEQRVAARTASLRSANEKLKNEIAERHRAELALRASQERLRAFADALPDVAFVLDETGRYIEVLASRPMLLAAEQRKLRGKLIRDVLDPQTARDCLDLIVRTLETGEPQTMEYTLKVPAGERIFEGRTSPMSLRVEGRRTVVWVAIDITERRAMQAKAHKREEQLAHVTRISTLGEMASMLAHELNQPLAAISNYASGCLRHVREGRGQSGSLEQGLQQTVLQAGRAGQIIRNMRSFVVKREVQKQVMQVNDAVRLALELTMPQARQSLVQLVTDLDADLPCVFADAIQMEQVMVNLVRNAIEATSAVEPPRRVAIQTRADHDQVIITLTDTGVGLSPQQRARLFEPFFTTKPNGMGMGLNICRSIVEAHGGRLTFFDHQPRGTRVEIVLPI